MRSHVPGAGSPHEIQARNPIFARTRGLWGPFVFALIGGCAASAGSAAANGVEPEAWSYVYECERGFAFSVRFVEDLAVVVADGRRMELPRAMSASGARYATPDIEFWGKGDEATFSMPPARYTECQANPADSPWEDAALRGVTYRGIGNEPGWYVEVKPDESLLLVADYGEDVTLAGPPIARRDSIIGRVDYTAHADTVMIRLLIDEMPCIDTMSGEVFPTRARVELTDDTLLGCGRWLTQ